MSGSATMRSERLVKLGKYEIRSTLGRGAMGTVYEGWDPLISRRVAIKTVRLPAAEDEAAQDELARFRREAQAAGRLNHPNLVGVYDYGEADDFAYIVMEFVDGKPLKATLDADERLTLPTVRRVMADLLAGLAYSHERGVIHRDIKPANVMLTSDGQAKVADFGIARIESSSMTQAGTVLGTPAYMSPEQFMGQVVDARTDIYSSGVLLYQLLTGEKPFEGSLTAIMHKVLNTVPPRPSELSVTAPSGLDAVVVRAMARRPEDRYPTAAAFAEAINAALDAPGAAAPTAIRSDTADVDATVVASSAVAQLPPRLRAFPSEPEAATMVQTGPAMNAAGPVAAQAAAAPASGAELPPRQQQQRRSGAPVVPLAAAGAAAVLALAGGTAWWLMREPEPPIPRQREPVVQEQAAQERAAQERATQERLAQERAAQEQEAQERLAQERTARERATRERETQERAAQERTTQEQAAQERAAQERAAQDRLAQERAAQERLAQERAAQDRLAQERVAQERAAQERAAQNRAAQERAAQERAAQERAAQERMAQERAAQERAAQERATQERLAQERAAQERAAQERTAETRTPPTQQQQFASNNTVAPSTTGPDSTATQPPLTADALRSAVAAAVRNASCTVVTGDVARDGRTTLRGVAGQGGPAAALRGQVEGLRPPGLDWQVTTFDAPHCDVLDTVRPYARQFGESGGLLVGLKNGQTSLRIGDRLLPAITLGDFPAYLQVDYFTTANGQSIVYHMRTAVANSQPAPARSVQVIGEPRPADKPPYDGYQAQPPPGTDLIVAVASSLPLFDRDMPEFEDEPTGPYLERLRNAAAATVRLRGRVSASIFPLRLDP